MLHRSKSTDTGIQ